MKNVFISKEVKAMKKVLILVVVAAVFSLMAGVALAAISGTPHDLRTGTALEMCAFCHTPHQGSGTEVPLWNRSQAATVYDLYDNTVSATFDMTSNGTLRAPSTLCMVCHNGVASTLVNYPGPGSTADTNYDSDGTDIGGGTLDTWTNLGIDLRNEHPVSFDYDPALDNATDNNGFPTAVNGRIAGKYPLYGATKDWFECATCHAVHNTVTGYGQHMTGNVSDGSQVHFLRSTNAASAMCLDCHVNR